MLSFAALLVRLLLKPLRFFVGYDVFISYARKGSGIELVAALRKNLPRINVRCDLQGAGLGATPGWRLFAAIAMSRVLVVIGTEEASRSEYVCDEVRFFKTWNGGPAVPVEAGWPIDRAAWRVHIPGPARVSVGGASARILDCIGFWHRGRRLVTATTVAAVLLATLGWQGWLARRGATSAQLAERARTLPAIENAHPNNERALIALESWRAKPNPAALELMSQALGQLTARVVGTWESGTGYVRQIALDPGGEWVAASGQTTIAVGRTSGKVASRRLETSLAADLKGLALSRQGQEISLLTSGIFQRLRVDDWKELDRIELPQNKGPLLSADAHWIAVPGPAETELISTRVGHPRRRVGGKVVCFENGWPASTVLTVFTDQKSGKPRFARYSLDDSLSSGPLPTAVEAILPPGPQYSCSASALADKAQLLFVDDEVQRSTTEIPYLHDSVVFSSDGSVFAALNTFGVSHLWPYQTPNHPLPDPIAFLPGSSALAFGPRGEIAASESEESFLWILQVADARVRWDSQLEDVPPTELIKFKGLSAVQDISDRRFEMGSGSSTEGTSEMSKPDIG